MKKLNLKKFFNSNLFDVIGQIVHITWMTVITLLIVGLTSCSSCVTPPPSVEKMNYTYEYETLTPGNMMMKSEVYNINDDWKTGKELLLKAISDEGIMVAESATAPTEMIYSKLTITDSLAPQTYVVVVRMSAADSVPINSISLVVKYDTTRVKMLGKVDINDKIYFNQLNPDLPEAMGNTIYNAYAGYPEDNYNSMRLSMWTLENLYLQKIDLFTFVVEIKGTTAIRFSDIQGWLEYTDLSALGYPNTIQNVKYLPISY